MAPESDRPRNPAPASPGALPTPRYVATLFMICWLLSIWGVVSGVFALSFTLLVVLGGAAEFIGSLTGLAFIEPLVWTAALLVVIPFAVLLLICLPICALVVILQHRRPPPQRNRGLLKTALLTGCLASFIGFFLGSTYGSMLLIAGFAPWEEGATAGVLVLGSILAFTSGFRTWRYFRSL